MKSITLKNKKNKKNKTQKRNLKITKYKNDIILVSTPNKKAIEIANQDIHKYLFKDKVNVEVAINQHQNFKEILKQLGQKYIDINKYLPKKNSLEGYTNLLYTRDPFIRTPKGIIIGQMREDVRKNETEIINKILKKLKQPIIYRCKGDEYLEGGDFLINCNTAFIGTGPRTNMKAAKKLLKLNLYGTQRVVIIYPLHTEKSMYRIHLDCYFSPFGCKQCVIWDDLTYKNSTHKRIAIEYTLQSNGTYKKTSNPESLYNYLKNNNYDIIKVSTKSQQNYGTNLLELNNGTILVQDEETHKKIKNSIFVPFYEIHKMYGGLHCASNTIVSVSL
jgi:N-dimethylarginine dimethylaminohydrolase